MTHWLASLGPARPGAWLPGLCLLLGTMLVAGGNAASAEPFDPGDGDAGSGVVHPVYRFYNRNTGGHFYTIDLAERNAVIAGYPWFRDEGFDFIAYPTQRAGTLPVYRFFDTDSGNHFYTMSESEKDAVVSSYPWFRLEGIGFYAHDSWQAATVPVYRFADTSTGGHFYTTRESERDNVIANYPWFRFEGVGFFAPR